MPWSRPWYCKLNLSVVERKMALLMARSFDSVVSPAGKVPENEPLVEEPGLPVIVKSMSALVCKLCVL